jgi:D-inositol-3-phosphate glycosyltransferase
LKTPSERINGLRWRLRAMRRLWSPGVAPELPFLEPEPIDSRAWGEIDFPQAGERIEEELLEVRGWAIFPGAPTSRVEVWLDEKPIGRARLGMERPDLEEHSDVEAARLAGFQLIVDRADLPPLEGGATLRVTATGVDGQTIEVGAVPIEFAAVGGTEAAAKRLPPPAEETPRAAPGRGLELLVCTHQLNLGGAQLYLMDLLRGLLELEAVRPTVVSALDGSLRLELEEMGIPVHICGPPHVDDVSSYLGRVEELADWAADRHFDAALVNTATGLAMPGAAAAARLGIPTVWAIHESFPLAFLWPDVDAEVRRRGEEALRGAALVLFEADATRRMFERHLDEGRGVVIPYGLDFGPIDSRRAALDPVAARREVGIAPDEEVILCVGTVEPRKAQVQLAQAFGLIADRHPRARLVFVGVADTPASDLLAGAVKRSPCAERVELIPITPDVERWYAVADLLVSAADVESLPRTVLEAMAWETPVLATDVFGLPELIDDGETGWLCEARDTEALADGLDRALSATEEERRRIARAARELVVSRHSLERYAGEVADLLEKATKERAATLDAGK